MFLFQAVNLGSPQNRSFPKSNHLILAVRRWRKKCVGVQIEKLMKILSDNGSFLLPEHLKNDLTSLLSKNKKYKGHWKIISLANTTKIYKSGTWAKYIKRLCQLYFFKQNTPSAVPGSTQSNGHFRAQRTSLKPE